MATDKTAWLLSPEATAWRKALDQAVKDGTIHPSVRNAVLSPGEPVALEDVPPREIWNQALEAAAKYLRYRGLNSMAFDMIKELKK